MQMPLSVGGVYLGLCFVIGIIAVGGVGVSGVDFYDSAATVGLLACGWVAGQSVF